MQADAFVLLVCSNQASKDGRVLNVSDYTLMVSYVMSLQYYAIFRCAGPDTDGHPLDLAVDVHQEECKTRVWDTARIHAYTESIEQILTATTGEDTHLDLSGVGREIIDKAANSPWIGKILSGEDYSSIVDQAALSAEPDFVDRLKIWFAYKLQGEQQRHTAGHHLDEDDEVFNETDRVVEAVLRLRFDILNADNQHTAGEQTTTQHRLMLMGHDLFSCCSMSPSLHVLPTDWLSLVIAMQYS